MAHYLSAAALVASAALTAAAPAAKGDFSIDQVSKGSFYKSGPLAMAKTYSKYAKHGAVMPENVSIAATAASTGSVSASPESYDESYLIPVSIGGTTFHLDLDTGSSDLWVFSTQQPASQRSGHTAYKQTGTKKSGYTWNISYGDGSGAKGDVYVDKVVVGGVTATSQAVEAATSVSSSFTSDTDNDGLIGAAFSSINTVSPQQQLTFFDNVKNSLSQKLFAARLRYHTAGTYDYGYIDSSKYSGSIHYVPVNTANGFWEFTASGVSGSSIADTGTTLLYIPDSNVDAYYANVDSASYDSSQGGYTFDCDESLPDWTVTIGSGSITVPGEYINFAPVSGNTCFGGIQSSDGIGFNIFGDIFLKATYTVFDQTQSSPRLGFAQGA
uniref:Aspartic proteinase n=1 Tax=Leptoxyphium fumago TaxID=5474 RepID=A0A2I7YBS4_LEPFU|nr:aspartic proteinase [Leptoxyphium fumago]